MADAPHDHAAAGPAPRDPARPGPGGAVPGGPAARPGAQGAEPAARATGRRRTVVGLLVGLAAVVIVVAVVLLTTRGPDAGPVAAPSASSPSAAASSSASPEAEPSATPTPAEPEASAAPTPAPEGEAPAEPGTGAAAQALGEVFGDIPVTQTPADEPAPVGPGLVATLVSVEPVTSEGTGIGQYSGPAFLVTLELANATDAPVAVADTMVTGYEVASAAPVTLVDSDPRTVLFAGELAPGASARGVFVFRDPAGAGLSVAIMLGTQGPVLVIDSVVPANG